MFDHNARRHFRPPQVEKQMPAKHEHVVRCRLSKRQRLLYDEYMAATEVQETMAGGSFLGIINVLMQLRKVGGRLHSHS